MKACAGKLLFVNLTDRSTRAEPLSEETLRAYLLGSGLAARLYMDLPDLPEPLAPEAPLYMMTGLLTGTIVPCGCRTLVCGRSPLTGIWNESTAGGYFGAELRFAGWDGIVLSGRAAEPTLLWIHDDVVTFLPGADLWGLETPEAAEAVRAATDSKAQTALIGPAGEKGIPMANIMFGVPDNRTAGRGGMGAIMGAKNLKAIAVRGSSRPGYADSARLRELVKEANSQMRDVYVGLSQLGTGGGIVPTAEVGDLPVKNWAGGDWVAGARVIGTAAMAERGIKTSSYRCFACPVACTQEIQVPAGPYAGLETHAPEYETLAGFGANCLNDDMDAIITANERCNHLGIDTISASAAIAFAMEAVQRGHMDPAGYDLSWGNRETILQLVEEIGAGAGLGVRLGRGVRALAEELGPQTVPYAPHVKGMEMPYHDPRAETSMAASYATSSRGACHLSSITYAAIRGTQIRGAYMPAGYHPHSNEGKGRMAAEWQNFMSVVNALGLCKLVSKSVIDPYNCAAWLNAAFGWDMDHEELLRAGERIFNVQRLVNLRLGVTREDDWLPDRFTRDARPDGGAAGVLPDLGPMMEEYYSTRGWDAAGRPMEETLRRLSL